MIEVRRLKIELTTQEPFRIGALKDVLSGIENPVARIGKRVVVQGPTLKGALRANIEEYLINQFPHDPGMKPCIPASRPSGDEQALIKAGKYRDGGACQYSTRTKSSSICPACYLLGANGLMGFVRVPYLYTDSESETLYSVRIDRGTNVVAEGTNRDYQIIPDGTVFSGELEVLVYDPRRDWTLGKPRQVGKEDAGFKGDKWLESGKWNGDKIIEEFITDRLQSIELLGGFKSKGCGKVKIKVEPI